MKLNTKRILRIFIGCVFISGAILIYQHLRTAVSWDVWSALKEYRIKENGNIRWTSWIRSFKIFEHTSKTLGCPHSTLENSANIQDFQCVELPTSTIYVYSALLHDKKVAFIALKNLKTRSKALYCKYVYSKEDGMRHSEDEYIVKASVYNMNEHHDKEYTAAFITCHLSRRYIRGNKEGRNQTPQSNFELPIKVLLVVYRNKIVQPLAEFEIGTDKRFSDGDKSNASVLKKHFLEPEKSKVVEFTVCSPVIHSNYSNDNQLVEMLEMSRLLGARRVVLYNNSITPNVDAVLRAYSREYEQGRDSLEVIVHSWKLPAVMSSENLHYYGQMAAINDCLYRYRYSSNYIVFTDLDEFIVPHQASNWSQLITTLRKRNPNFSGFMFKNTNFRLQWNNPAPEFQVTAEKYKSAILGHTQKENCTFPKNVRTKMIVDPLATDEIGIHYAWRMRGETYIVPEKEGISHHYRNVMLSYEFHSAGLSLKQCNNPVTDVYAVTVFGSRLAAQLNAAWRMIAGL